MSFTTGSAEQSLFRKSMKNIFVLLLLFQYFFLPTNSFSDMVGKLACSAIFKLVIKISSYEVKNRFRLQLYWKRKSVNLQNISKEPFYGIPVNSCVWDCWILKLIWWRFWSLQKNNAVDSGKMYIHLKLQNNNM